MRRAFLCFITFFLLFQNFVGISNAQGSQICSIVGGSIFRQDQLLSKSGVNNTTITYVRIDVQVPSGIASQITRLQVEDVVMEDFSHKLNNAADYVSRDDVVNAYTLNTSSDIISIFLGQTKNSSQQFFPILQTGTHEIQLYRQGLFCNPSPAYTISEAPFVTPTSTPSPTQVPEECAITINPSLSLISYNTPIFANINGSRSVLETYANTKVTDDTQGYRYDLVFKYRTGSQVTEIDRVPLQGSSINANPEQGADSIQKQIADGIDPGVEGLVEVQRVWAVRGNPTSPAVLCSSAPIFPGAVVTETPTPSPTQTAEQDRQTSLCRNIDEDSEEYDDCVACMGADGAEFQGQVYTAFGCIPSTLDGFLQKFVFQIGLGLAGVVAFLLMLWGSFKMIISQGDPQQLQQGREVIISAGAGLLLIIFSVLIIQFFGFNVLRLPGFNAPTIGDGTSTIPEGDPAFNDSFRVPTPTPTVPIIDVVIPDFDTPTPTR